jgi:hypothetical protein
MPGLPPMSPAGVCVIAGPTGIGRVPLDKEKGVVKGEDILSGAEHRLLLTSESVGARLWDITAESLFWWIAPPNHRYDRNYYHDSSIRTSSRRVCAEVGNTGGVFQGAGAVFCIDRSGCESTQSKFRADFAQGHPRVALDMNDLRIADITA